MSKRKTKTKQYVKRSDIVTLKTDPRIEEIWQEILELIKNDPELLKIAKGE